MTKKQTTGGVVVHRLSVMFSVEANSWHQGNLCYASGLFLPRRFGEYSMNEQGPFHGIPLPKDWPQHIKLAVIHSVALSHRAITFSRSFAINSSIERVRLAGELDRVQNEMALIREELRIKDARMTKLPVRSKNSAELFVPFE